MIDTTFYNQQRSGYEELVSYGPYFYKNILEMDANYKFAGKTLDIMANGLETIIHDQFIDSADEETISRMEKWLAIDDAKSRSLEDRKKKVKLIWNGGEKLSGNLIKNMVKSYTGCDEDPSVRMTTFLRIQTQAKEENTIYLADLLDQLNRMKPAHIRLEFNVVFSSKMRFSTKLSHYLFNYDKTGEKPDVATHGSYQKTTISAKSNLLQNTFDYMQSSEQQEAGIFPNIATKGALISNTYSIPDIHSDRTYEYQSTSESNESGTYPDITTAGSFDESALSIKTEEKSLINTYVECGSKSCGEEVL